MGTLLTRNWENWGVYPRLLTNTWRHQILRIKQYLQFEKTIGEEVRTTWSSLVILTFSEDIPRYQFCPKLNFLVLVAPPGCQQSFISLLGKSEVSESLYSLKNKKKTPPLNFTYCVLIPWRNQNPKHNMMIPSFLTLFQSPLPPLSQTNYEV